MIIWRYLHKCHLKFNNNAKITILFTISNRFIIQGTVKQGAKLKWWQAYTLFSKKRGITWNHFESFNHCFKCSSNFTIRVNVLWFHTPLTLISGSRQFIFIWFHKPMTEQLGHILAKNYLHAIKIATVHRLQNHVHLSRTICHDGKVKAHIRLLNQEESASHLLGKCYNNKNYHPCYLLACCFLFV